MKKFVATLYWIGYIAVNLLAYNLFALIIVMSLALPNSILSGFFAWSLIILMMLFAADDETLKKFKDLFVR
jgi:hypothetical protein